MYSERKSRFVYVETLLVDIVIVIISWHQYTGCCLPVPCSLSLKGATDKKRERERKQGRGGELG